jgi:hypothetical protein
MKEKKKCSTCKKQPKTTKSLINVELDRVEKAYQMLQTPSLMDDTKWDYVEDVYMELFPAKSLINRQCRECLVNVAKAVEYEYRRLKRKTENI